MADQAFVPTVDLSSVTGAQLLAGLQEASCVFLTGLGPILGQVEALVSTSRRFFELPEADKALVQWSGTGPWAGWQPLYAGGAESLLLERFEVTLPDPSAHPTASEWVGCFGQWPAHPAEMSEVWGGYYRSMRTLCDRLTTLLIDALGLPAGDLPAWTTGQHSNLVVNHYLTQLDPPTPGRVRQQPHTDHGGLTLLWADGSPGGLEAQIGEDGTWVPVTFPADALLLQAGDLLHLWSGGVIPANNHRVVNPPRALGLPQTDRYSVVFFHHPDLDSWVAPSSQDEAGVKARDYVMARQRRSYVLD